MSWPRLFIYAVIMGYAYCEENNIPVGPLIWHSLMVAFARISNLFWNAGIYSAQQYRKAIENHA